MIIRIKHVVPPYRTFGKTENKISSIRDFLEEEKIGYAEDENKAENILEVVSSLLESLLAKGVISDEDFRKIVNPYHSVEIIRDEC